MFWASFFLWYFSRIFWFCKFRPAHFKRLFKSPVCRKNNRILSLSYVKCYHGQILRITVVQMHSKMSKVRVPVGNPQGLPHLQRRPTISAHSKCYIKNFLYYTLNIKHFLINIFLMQFSFFVVVLFLISLVFYKLLCSWARNF